MDITNRQNIMFEYVLCKSKSNGKEHSCMIIRARIHMYKEECKEDAAYTEYGARQQCVVYIYLNNHIYIYQIK